MNYARLHKEKMSFKTSKFNAQKEYLNYILKKDQVQN